MAIDYDYILIMQYYELLYWERVKIQYCIHHHMFPSPGV